ncbi:MAG: hypothetical protein R2736_10440 [Solirubrobacterales bacterium]
MTGVAPGRALAGEQVGAYLRAIDAASPRVTSAVLGSSTQGRPLPYAVVARTGNARPPRLDRGGCGRSATPHRGHPAARTLQSSG